MPGLLEERATTMPEGAAELRQDGSIKGEGWLGPLKRKDGRTATELSISIELDGKEYDMPLLVPGLTDEELTYLLDNDPDPKNVPSSIANKAIEHAVERMKQGLSPYAQP